MEGDSRGRLDAVVGRVPKFSYSMNAYWGDQSWEEVAYDKNLDLFGQSDVEKVSNPRFAEAFRQRLKKVAGFAKVPDLLPMRNKKRSVVYYLFFASQKGTAENIVKYIFDNFGTHTF